MPLSRRQILQAFGLACLGGDTLVASGPRSAAAWTPPQPKAALPPGSPTPADLANRVRDEFRHAWNGYKQYAWGHDELRPLSKSYRDWHSMPLLMTPVDALDTMILMGMDEEAARTREF